MIEHLVFLFATWAAILGGCWASSDFPCPPAVQIAPCLCSVNADKMQMDCSDVDSTEHLKEIFHSSPPFPFTHFSKFLMEGNQNVEKLENGVFNVITFDEIEVTNGALVEVEQGSIEQSKEVLQKITMYGNQIERFLMNDAQDLTAFTELWYINLSGNVIQVFPAITSDKVTYLAVSDNPMTTIHNENLFGVPYLEHIHIDSIRMNILETKLLSNHRHLITINLSSNNLVQIQSTALIVQSPTLKEINLSNNRINDVEPGSFDTNVHGLKVNLDDNNLSTLDELTWKPLAKSEVSLTFNGNPLGCGCDMKWAVIPDNGEDYISFMEGTCPEGQSFTDLEPAWYEQFCN
ncbi:unnamed protein product [Meganyctiphanes norvegica]|uniref:Oplophorus-luciferin 2-monooxygenase non-catalytic subunit n=1 Tax=Meganyctiphanes norvegica TaxID=48144 RepID=A0AAV2QBX8_MEGNR